MIRMSVLLGCAALLATPSLAKRQDPDFELAKLLAGRSPGKPVDCLPLSRYSDTRTIGSTVAYRVASTWYVNRFSGGCPSLRPGNALVSRHNSSRICRGDIAQVVIPSAGVPLGSCVFDSFTPYTSPRKDK
ncbi:hypothetical protein [uncultured Sphingomonas sp.]|uniref:hypothetical protein n=1 Tax=uncultured Sphingomonas sp. TaxID=158754 RepID=UPI0025D6DBFA|nr:hypothetical protein [uncultured Sphingomonas sp.]